MITLLGTQYSQEKIKKLFNQSHRENQWLIIILLEIQGTHEPKELAKELSKIYRKENNNGTL